MLLTLYYIAATWLQSWRIRKMCNLLEKLIENSSVVFYTVPTDVNVTANLATSELCVNRFHARIAEFLWLKDNQRGCSLIPKQNINLSPWVTFPEERNLTPFDYNDFDKGIKIDKDKTIHLLLETDIVPNHGLDGNDVVMIEEYGKPVAWKIDSHLAVLLESDLNQFTKLIMSTFMQNNFFINDRLPLIRIESVQFDGQPQLYELLRNHCRKQLINRFKSELSPEDWEKHISELQNFSILASQAAEFEYNKNRTEGKTGIVKPDLIPSKNIDEIDSKKFNLETISSPKQSSKKIEAKISPVRNLIEIKSKNLLDEPRISQKDLTVSPEKQKLSVLNPPVVVDNVKKLVPNNSTQIALTSLQKQPILTKIGSNEIIDKLNENESSQKSCIVPEPVKNSSVKSTEKSEAILTQKSILPIDMQTTKCLPPKLQLQTQIEEQQSPVFQQKIASTLTLTQNLVEPIPKPTKPESSSKIKSERPTLVRTKGNLIASKPPNVLVYSESVSMKDSVFATLRNILEPDTYTIYPLSAQQAMEKIWIDTTRLLVVCGSVNKDVELILLDYFLKGGKLLSLCSDILHIVLPTYRTAEVREHELVQFSYGKWQKVKMMHHIFCYQPSPIKKHFSHDGEDSVPQQSKKPAIVCPRCTEVKDLQGTVHNLDVKVLGIEETWNTPSLLLAVDGSSGGKAVFSQVHLEADPAQFESDETQYTVLTQNNKARIEIFADLLKSQLGAKICEIDKNSSIKYNYKAAYFLGRHDSKFDLLDKLKPKMQGDKLIETKNITLQFCGKGTSYPSASETLLPILIHSCPEDFSTVDYYDSLKTNAVGRLVIYIPLVTSSMHLISELNLTHGIAVIAKLQSNGTGRNSNQWLSPEGCVMFSLQLHIGPDTVLGRRISLMQHLIATAMVNAILEMDGYENLDLRLKWPNDIFANGISKIGGIIINTQLNQTSAICNIGGAINLNNSKPTVCVNDLIKDYNKNFNKNLPLLVYEKLLAQIFNKIEELLDRVQTGDLVYLNELYYKYWLHGDQEVTVIDKAGRSKLATIVGIDDFGYLEVKMNDGTTESVQPDGNSFDMLRGLILPK